MKKLLLKVFGVAALAAGMLYNVQVSDVANDTGISLAALGNVAEAGGEDDAGDKFFKMTWTESENPYFFLYECRGQLLIGWGEVSKTITKCIHGGTEDCTPGTVTIVIESRPC